MDKKKTVLVLPLDERIVCINGSASFGYPGCTVMYGYWSAIPAGSHDFDGAEIVGYAPV